jgi:pilus assembly protein CpaB
VTPRRTVILVVAVVVAAVAAFSTYAWLNGVQDRAYEDAKLVKVYKVAKDIEKGVAGEQALESESVRADEAPEEFRPATALTDINVIRGKVALTKLSAGQIVVDGMFVDPRTEQVTASQRIEPGRVAVTVSVDQVEGVAGLLVPGDRVDIMLTRSTGGLVNMLFQNVEILFIGTTAAPQPGETQAVAATTSNLITFSVPPLAAEKLVRATRFGDMKITLALVPPDNQPVPVPPVDERNILTGGLTPYEG